MACRGLNGKHPPWANVFEWILVTPTHTQFELFCPTVCISGNLMQAGLKLLHILNGSFSLGTINYLLYLFFPIKNYFYLFNCAYMCACVLVGEFECNDPGGSQKRPTGAGVKAVMSSPIWILGTQLRSSGRAASAIYELFLQPLFCLIQMIFA